MSADINAIAIGHRGRVAMLNALFGGPGEPMEKLGPQTLREALGR